MKKMRNSSRIIIAFGAAALVVMYFVPAWSIYLIAPQYPEGLSMQIWLNKITGQVEIINGLNHYIGMKHIHASMFPEFNFLIYILGFFILFALAVAITGSRKLLFYYLVLSVIGGMAAMADFYKWGYDYGHNLDPSAAIQVPGFSYQPPLIGHKKLLNFDAYSYPDTGGLIVVGVTGIFLILWFLEWRRQKKYSKQITMRSMKPAIAALIVAGLFLTGCNPKIEKINFGKDECAECKMTIVEPKFGAEIVTKKGKVYKFDDTHCIAVFLERRGVELSNIYKTLFVPYNGGEFIEVSSAEFVVSSQLKSPMGGNAAAFKNAAEAEKVSAQIPGSKTTNWATLYNILVR
jgi:copper chaperone NosL